METVGCPKEFFTKSRVSEEEFEHMQVDTEIDTVVSWGIDNWTYHLLWYVSLVIRNGAKYVCANPDSLGICGESGRLMPNSGALMTAIQYSADIEPIIVAKPKPNIFHMLWEDHNLSDIQKDKFIMFGDKIDGDIAFAHNWGIDSWLVLTGVSRKENLDNLHKQYPEYKPTYVLDSVKDLVSG